MSAIEEVYYLDNNEYGIVCTQESVVVDYKRIKNQTAHLFKKNYQMIQDPWLLLDNCLTISIIYNPHFVTDFHEVDQQCIVNTNIGTGSTNLMATLKPSVLPLKKKVRFDYNEIANFIALKTVQDQFKVSYSNWFGTDINKFVVMKHNDSKMKFTMSRKRLYYMDTLYPHLKAIKSRSVQSSCIS